MAIKIDGPGFKRTYKVLHMFSGIGGGALGFQQAKTAYKGLSGRFETICGIDVDPDACKDFEMITGSRAVCMDLFDKTQYEAFYGTKPSKDWREITAVDILKATNGVCPDIVFTSPPCKGFSGLLPKAASESAKYQALNQLTVRSIRLVLDAFRENLPAAILFENVPRIATRGSGLISEIKNLLLKSGYLFHEGYHDCGVIGGLGQHRKRYLLIARNERRMPSFIYYPPQKRVKSIGEIIGPMPLPDDSNSGLMHRLPRLQWKTWIRLALIPAGGDWRDLEDFAGDGKYNHSYKIVPWNIPAGVVTSGHSPSCGGTVVADPRLCHVPRKSTFGVQKWKKASGTVTGNMRPGGSCATCIADPRVPLKKNRHLSHFRIIPFCKPGNTITGATHVANGSPCIADPRLSEKEGRHPAVYQIVRWDDTSPCITGTRFGSGSPAVADPRLKTKGDQFNGSPGLYGVNEWDTAMSSVTGSAKVSSSNCPSAIADPRINCYLRNGSYGVHDWNCPAATVSGSADVHQGACAIADPRFGYKMRNGNYKVQESDPRIPGDAERPDPPPIIIAVDGTWHRPLTTLELAALQSFPTKLRDGAPLVLSGKSDMKWRERIGNAVPPYAAEAIALQILNALLVNEYGDFILSGTQVWVEPEKRHQREDIPSISF